MEGGFVKRSEGCLVYDRPRALAGFCHDEAALRSALEGFVQQADVMRRRIRRTIQAEDRVACLPLVHWMRSGLEYLGAAQAAEASAALEAALRSGATSEVAHRLADFESSLKRLRRRLLGECRLLATSRPLAPGPRPRRGKWKSRLVRGRQG